jgi:hypothetical protein
VVLAVAAGELGSWGAGGSWRELEGAGGSWRELEGAGGSWRELEGARGSWRELGSWSYVKNGDRDGVGKRCV